MKAHDVVKFSSYILLVFIAALLSGCDKDEEVVKVTDVDGNTYEAVTIGTQVWLRANLKVTHYRNGDAIIIRDRTHWDPNSTEGAFTDYDDSPANGEVYGHLYNWYAVSDPRGLAPDGYHVSTDSDWRVLGDFLGGDTIAGGKLKEVGFSHWMSPNTGATDEVDFTALAGGERVLSLSEDDALGMYAAFWTSTPSSQYPELASFRALAWNNAEIYGRDNGAAKSGAFSVRCVKD